MNEIQICQAVASDRVVLFHSSIPHFSGTRSIRYLLYIVMLSTSLAYRLSSNSVKNSNTSFALASAAVMDFPENKAKEEFEDE